MLYIDFIISDLTITFFQLLCNYYLQTFTVSNVLGQQISTSNGTIIEQRQHNNLQYLEMFLIY